MKFVAIDVETTGTNILTDDVLQIAAIAFTDDGEITATFNQYATTQQTIHDDAIAVHGLSKQKLAELGARPPHIVGKAFKGFVEMNSANVIGHNVIGFDLPMTWNWIRRNDTGMFVLPAIDTVYDTMMSARSVLGTRKWLKNSELAEALGIEFDKEKLHDALYDLEITVKNFLAMRGIDHIRLNDAIQRLPEILARRPTR